MPAQQNGRGNGGREGDTGFRNERLQHVEGLSPDAPLGEPVGKEQVLLTCPHLAGLALVTHLVPMHTLRGSRRLRAQLWTFEDAKLPRECNPNLTPPCPPNLRAHRRRDQQSREKPIEATRQPDPGDEDMRPKEAEGDAQTPQRASLFSS